MEELNDRGIACYLLSGIPFIPSASLPTFRDKLRILQTLDKLGASAHIWEEGVTIGPPRPRR